jgi:hypothetical protein
LSQRHPWQDTVESAFRQDQDDLVLVPVSLRRLSNLDHVDSIFVQAAPGRTARAMDEVREVLRRHRIRLGRDDGGPTPRHHDPPPHASPTSNAIDPPHRHRPPRSRLPQGLDELINAPHPLAKARVQLSEQDRARIRRLAKDLKAVWKAPTTQHEDRKAMVALVIEAVSLQPVDVPKRATLVRVQWKTGAIDELLVARPSRRQRLKPTHLGVACPAAERAGLPQGALPSAATLGALSTAAECWATLLLDEHR